MGSDKQPTSAKPRLYAMYFQALMEIARGLGYNLLISGSMNRDLDLVAVPWTNYPKPEMELIWAFEEYLNGPLGGKVKDYMHKMLPGGRSSYVINLNRIRDNDGVDPQYYLDISITPLVVGE